jgi:hypothetical protein
MQPYPCCYRDIGRLFRLFLGRGTCSEKNLLPGEETKSFKTKDGITLIGLFTTLGDTPKI